MAAGAISAANTSTPGANTQRSSIADNFDAFLLLLTTQLKNQNPLDPMDANQFTQQLVQFAGVEQQIKGNDTLATILSMMDTNKNSSAIGFIGKDIVSEGKTSQLSGGKATWYMSTTEAAPKSYITIRDENGNEVYSREVEISQGTSTFSWDGTKNNGQPAADGFYSITIDARNGAGNVVQANTKVSGTVNGVDLAGNEPVLIIGSSRIPLKDVISVQTPSS